MAGKGLSPQQRGRRGGLIRAALTDNKASMARVRAAKEQRYRDRVIEATNLDPVADAAEIQIRANKLRTADMIAMSAKAADARRALREAKAALAEITDDETELAEVAE